MIFYTLFDKYNQLTDRISVYIMTDIRLSKFMEGVDNMSFEHFREFLYILSVSYQTGR
jgi:hypothetical protein